jgi:hypothetical protein
MTRTIESILNAHHAAQARRDAGEERWERGRIVIPSTLRGLPWQERRDGIVRSLRASWWFKQYDEFDDLPQFVDELADAESAEHMDQVMNAHLRPGRRRPSLDRSPLTPLT